MTAFSRLAAVLLVKVAGAAVTFTSIGDWGGAGITDNPDDYHRTNEYHVAEQFGKTMDALDSKFVINTGDNFYFCGVMNTTDSQWKTDFEDVFTNKATFVPWYGVLGNHDYALNESSQFEYKSPNNDRWQIPDYYYSKRILLGGSQYATFIFIDSSPCVADYRGSDQKQYDPCSGTFGDECFYPGAGKCLFHEHIMAQDCDKQFAWFQKELAAVSDDDWLFVVGHHEADQINVQDFTAAMLSSKVRLYLNGHTHAMKHYNFNTDIDFLTTGAGCMVHTKDQDVCTADTCLNATDDAHKPDELFYKKVSAFSVHTFSEDFSSLKTSVVGTDGATMYSFTTQKHGGSGPPPSPPSPTPPAPHPRPTPPAPSPTPSSGSCKDYGCKYSKEHSCQCNKLCEKHSDCCSDYETVCKKSDSELVV